MILPFFSLGNFTDNLMHRTKAAAGKNENEMNQATKHSGWVGGETLVLLKLLRGGSLLT